MENNTDAWNSGDPYEYFMGRWSRLMAPVFLNWINIPDNLSWLDVGCGTGALSEAIFQVNRPAYLCSVDPSPEFLEKAKAKKSFTADFFTGNASSLPLPDHTFDIVVSGLALNFFPDPSAALSEMQRVLKKDGAIAAYVWDYAGRMDFLRLFWDAAGEIDMNASKLDEGNRFPICNADHLRKQFGQSGLTDIETTFLDINTVFRDFEDYWNPFLGGQGPAPGYLASLDDDLQERIKNRLHKKLQAGPDGSIKLLARAIAVRGNYR
ncbi:MAG: class I SAM-dependent methyltransferase [Saprospiraceae bacterium]|nr:class I SAM-dependent methyltransferase [Saprospiraceae bacterium]